MKAGQKLVYAVFIALLIGSFVTSNPLPDASVEVAASDEDATLSPASLRDHIPLT